MQAVRSKKQQEEESNFYVEHAAVQDSPEECENTIEERNNEGGTAIYLFERVMI